MKTTVRTRDGRVVARVVNLVHQFGCAYTELIAQKNSDLYTATIHLNGPADALRRLQKKITTLTAHEDC